MENEEQERRLRRSVLEREVDMRYDKSRRAQANHLSKACQWPLMTLHRIHSESMNPGKRADASTSSRACSTQRSPILPGDSTKWWLPSSQRLKHLANRILEAPRIILQSRRVTELESRTGKRSLCNYATKLVRGRCDA